MPAPALRADLKLVPYEQLVRVYEPTMQRFVQLYPIECHIAQLMNGSRTIDELTALARQFNPSVATAVVQKLIGDLACAGLLVVRASQPSLPAQAGEIEWADVDGADANTVLERSSLVSPHDDAFEIPRGQPTLRVVPPPAPHVPVDDPATVLSPTDDDDWPEPEKPAVADDDWPEPEPAARTSSPVIADRMSAANIAHQEQEALWKDAHARKWHQRTWPRRSRVIASAFGSSSSSTTHRACSRRTCRATERSRLGAVRC